MKLIQDDFSEELSTLLKKHNKTIESDKNGIYIVDGSHKTLFISTPTNRVKQ